MATQWVIEMENKKYKDELSINGDIPFAEYFWKWFETYKEDSVSDRTYRTYVTAYHALKNNMPPILASKIVKPIDNLSSSMVAPMLNPLFLSSMHFIMLALKMQFMMAI